MNRMYKSQTLSTNTTFDSFLHEMRKSTSIVSDEAVGQSISLRIIPELSIEASIVSPRKQLSRTVTEDISPNDVSYEASLRNNCPSYQNLLILEKQLQLELMEEEQRMRRNQQVLRRKSTPNDERKQQIRNSQQTLRKKRQYALQYYNTIVAGLTAAADKRLNEIGSIEQKLERESQLLAMRLNEQRNSLAQIVIEKEAMLIDARRCIVSKRSDIDRIKEQRLIRQKANSVIARDNVMKRKQLEEAQRDYRQLQTQLQSLQIEQKNLQQINRSLKELLTIEQEHTKTCMVLQRAIILREQQKIMQEAYNRETSRQYENNMIPQLKTMNREKLKENDMFAKRLDERIKVVAQLLEKIQRVQDKIKAVSMSPTLRMTFTPGMSN